LKWFETYSDFLNWKPNCLGLVQTEFESVWNQTLATLELASTKKYQLGKK
jgi:hypothetical protein